MEVRIDTPSHSSLTLFPRYTAALLSALPSLCRPFPHENNKPLITHARHMPPTSFSLNDLPS